MAVLQFWHLAPIPASLTLLGNSSWDKSPGPWTSLNEPVLDQFDARHLYQVHCCYLDSRKNDWMLERKARAGSEVYHSNERGRRRNTKKPLEENYDPTDNVLHLPKKMHHTCVPRAIPIWTLYTVKLAVQIAFADNGILQSSQWDYNRNCWKLGQGARYLLFNPRQ